MKHLSAFVLSESMFTPNHSVDGVGGSLCPHHFLLMKTLHMLNVVVTSQWHLTPEPSSHLWSIRGTRTDLTQVFMCGQSFRQIYLDCRGTTRGSTDGPTCHVKPVVVNMIFFINHKPHKKITENDTQSQYNERVVVLCCVSAAIKYG